MPKKPDQISESQEIKQEAREIRREYFIFLPILLFVIVLIALSLTKSQPKTVVELVNSNDGSGYWIVYSNGEIDNYGSAGPVDAVELPTDTKFVAAQPAKEGFWAVNNKGGVSAIAGAQYSGSIDTITLQNDVAEMITHPNGLAYRLVGDNGPVYAFNLPPFSGGEHYDKPFAAAAPTTTGEGYWLLQPTGEVSIFGDAAYYPDIELTDEQVVDGAPYAGGMIILTNRGRLIILGDGKNYGDLASSSLTTPVVDIDPLNNNLGYRITTADGTVHSFGEAQTL